MHNLHFENIGKLSKHWKLILNCLNPLQFSNIVKVVVLRFSFCPVCLDLLASSLDNTKKIRKLENSEKIEKHISQQLKPIQQLDMEIHIICENRTCLNIFKYVLMFLKFDMFFKYVWIDWPPAWIILKRLKPWNALMKI